MKLLHIADLHAGKTLGRVNRNPDLYYALRQILDFCRDNKPDLILIAGDIFDKANPDSESKEIVFDFFLEAKSYKAEIVLIAGNHDSYDFLKSIKKLSRLAGVHIYDRPDKDNFLFMKGDLAIACLPYPSERVLTSAEEKSKIQYAEKVSRFLNYMADRVKEKRKKVLLTHLFIAGSRYTSTEREASLTQHYAVFPSSLPAVFDYVALGHVHRYQRVEASPTYAFYTGTLYQLDFSEAGEDKFFNFVRLEEGPPCVEAVKLDIKNPLNLFKLSQSEVLRRLGELKNTPGYLKLIIKVEERETLPFTMDRLREHLGERLVKVEQIEHRSYETKNLEFEKLTPLDLYREYHLLSYGKELPAEVEKTFTKLLEKAEELQL